MNDSVKIRTVDLEEIQALITKASATSVAIGYIEYNFGTLAGSEDSLLQGRVELALDMAIESLKHAKKAAELRLKLANRGR